MFGMESVYIGHSMKEFAAVREALAQGGIDYKYKVKNRNAQWLFPVSGTLRGRTGSLGVRPETENEYEILVKKEKADEARFLIGRRLERPGV